MDAAGTRARLDRIQDVTRLIRDAPFPVVAAVHGYALGAGCEFALSCDLVVAAEGTRFGFPEVGVGLSVTGGVSRLLTGAVGPIKAKELILLGEHFDAQEARRLGLVTRVSARLRGPQGPAGPRPAGGPRGARRRPHHLRP
ncbi:enoyl-CoA hydratase/isomerase family protein [Streptomyces sp. NPDC059080]|uniref:enoyl-CoA hydratase/isomerase family protein n=1 Tax=Streptomyces sp. NPDC059080 TaxID=3346718 RepID=UPI00367A3B3D